MTSKVSLSVMKKSLIDIMKLMIPFTPHLARESLDLLNSKTPNQWPHIDTKKLTTEINFAVQVNGKTRDIISLTKDTEEKEIKSIVLDKSKASKYIKDKKVLKTIFVKNKIINYIIKN